jgi:hypothetical protein
MEKRYFAFDKYTVYKWVWGILGFFVANIYDLIFIKERSVTLGLGFFYLATIVSPFTLIINRKVN